MGRGIAQVLFNALGLLAAARLVPGIDYTGGLILLIVAGLVLGLINLFVKPLVTLLSLPFIVVTLGLFFLLINGLMVYLAAALIPGLTVQGCMPAILGGVVLAIFNWLVRAPDVAEPKKAKS